MLKGRDLGLPGLLAIESGRIVDDRGFFSETYNANAFAGIGIDLVFVQDNHSFSARAGTLRGLHYQLPPRAQDKLVRVSRGRVLDVAVDIRRSAPTFGQWVALELSGGAGNQIFIPKGFAHGFLTLEDDTEVVYKVSDHYALDCDRSIRFDDPDIGIPWPWPADRLHMSDKDRRAPYLAAAQLFA